MLADELPTRRRARFHTLEVAAVRTLTAAAVEVTLTVPDELRDEFGYRPGQYVAVRATLAGEQVRRSYSICQAPTPGRLKVAIKRDLGGVFSSWAVEHLAPGMRLDVMSPEGSFVSRVERVAHGHYVAVAAGSGITPVLALIESTLRELPDAQFSLLYSNRTAMDTMFVDELADLKDRYPARLAIHHVLTRERRSGDLLSGRLDAARFHDILTTLIRPGTVTEWFLCGPFELVQLCRTTLAELGVDAARIRYELFTTGPAADPTRQHGRAVPTDAAGAMRTIQFRLDGTTGTVQSPENSGESVLNAALRVRGDVPFACAGGVCGTCRAVLKEGTVQMVENYALEPDELSRGYVLTCQAVPTSERVLLDYDT